MGIVLLALMYIVPAAFCSLFILVIHFCAKALGLRLSLRRLVVGISMVLILTPMWVPGALAIVPVPALVALVFGIVDGDLAYLLQLQTEIPIVSIIGITLTTLIAFLVTASIRDKA